MTKNIRGSNIKNIRTYIMGLIYRNSFSSVRVPSSMELARKFGVTRRTARMALEGLIAEDFLISKSGIGTFTNPKRGFKLSGVQQKTLIGLCFGDGSFFYYDAYTGKLFAEVMSQLLDADFNVYPLVHTSTEPELITAEIEYAGLDGAVFCNPNPDFSAVNFLRAANKPCVTIRYAVEGADFVQPQTTEALQKLVSIAEEEKRKKITVLVSEAPGNYLQSSVQAVEKYSKNSVEIELIEGLDPSIYEAVLAEIFSRPEETLPGMLLLGWRAPETAMRIMAEKGIAPERCSLIVDGAFSLPEGFSGYNLDVSCAEMTKEAVALLEQRFLHPELPPQTNIVEGKLIKINREGGRNIL